MKYIAGTNTVSGVESHPTRVRGLKYRELHDFVPKVRVAPYAGAWIEIWTRLPRKGAMTESHPTRVRGLKLAS